VASVADVEVSGEQDVRAAGGEPLHRHPRAPDDLALVVAGRQVERVVRDDDLEDLRAV
jgi:hypothetical protein